MDIVCNGETMSCLTVSSAWDEHGITALLLEKGSNPNLQNSRGFTAAHYSARNGCHNSLQCLIERGANVFIRDAEGNRPLDRAKAMRESACIDLLQRVEVVIYVQAILSSEIFSAYLDAETMESLYQFI
jgi:ankyrin repeat protein